MKRAVLCLVLASCLPPDVPPNPAALDETGEGCSAACTRLRVVGCPEGHGAVGGTSCEVVCVRMTVLRPLPLACWAAASTFSDAKACGALRCVH